ncbi:hypothetical protein PIB30_055793 [Stylosanthes scabra]|uniref:Replication protein A 70 kDa DNA-binding subunit B/D first OB fold domain-containing protein n=1 Tax=Stylosanthes scabra TaxID=79078 RepID=A0ABU6QIP6_9FABA|nr:hypothetical protein [Stylosanthes scabra]
MALATDFLEDVGPKKLGWYFNVYLIRLWEEPDKNNEKKINIIEMVIQDIKGTRVQGSIPDSLFKQWRDVVSEVVGKQEPREVLTSKGIKTKRMTITINDIDNYKINCVLFGDAVDKILPHFEDGRVEPVIIVCQYFKASRLNERTSVQSYFQILKLRINPDLAEVQEFRDRLLGDNPSTTVSINQISSGSSVRYIDELKQGKATVKTIGEVAKFTKKCDPVHQNDDNKYECKECHHIDDRAILRKLGNSDDGGNKTKPGGLPTRTLRCLSQQRLLLTLCLEFVSKRFSSLWVVHEILLPNQFDGISSRAQSSCMKSVLRGILSFLAKSS